MNMKNFNIFCLLLLTLPSVLFGKNNPEKRRPNIVFIMSDDHAYQAISAYSDKLIKTPNIDRIAKNGIKFTQACVTNSICAPSRATILTGKHSHLNSKTDNYFPFDTTILTFPQLFQESGYQTAMFGKLHFGNNPKGFDQFKILPGQGNYYNPNFITKNEGNIQVNGYVTDVITDMTLDWLEKERNPEKPFLLMYLHKAPHREWLPAERHLKEFSGKVYPEPSTLFDNYEGRTSAAKAAEMNLLTHMNWAGDSKIYPEMMDKLGIKSTTDGDKEGFTKEYRRMNALQKANWDGVYQIVNEQFEKKFKAGMTEKELMQWRFQRYMQDYLGTIASVDENVGRVLDYLEANNLTENTLIVYTSDQGFYLGEHGWYDKRFVYDESFKTPLLMQWKGHIKPGRVSDDMVQNLDFAQTFLDAAGIKAPSDMQGESMVPLLEGKINGWKRESVYYHYYEFPSVHMVKRHYAIVTKAYKLIHFYHDVNEWELIDRQNDPQELKNEYNNPKYADVVEKLKKELVAIRQKYGDSEEISKNIQDRYLKAINK